MRHKNVLQLTSDDQTRLEKWIRSPTTPNRLVLRSRIVLMAGDKRHDLEIGNSLNCSRNTVRLWRNRFINHGIDGIIGDAPGRGRKPIIDKKKIERIIEATLHTTPTNATHWSVRTMARQQKISPASIQRIWHRYQLKPHLTETFKLSKDPRFLEKLEDIVGLYLNPPDKALVFCFDEKSQIQALDRTRPILPLAPGIPERQTHDYIRHGTTTLFAAMNILDGKVIGECMERHRHQEFLKFLKRIDTQTSKRKHLHLVVDNYATHKHPRINTWLKRNPRFHLHFTPTSSSWLNLVERWFKELTDKRIRRGTFPSVKMLISAIKLFIKENNKNPKAFVWTASVDKIMAKINKINNCIINCETLH